MDNETSSFFTIIEVVTFDFPGLLFRVTDALFAEVLDSENVDHARAAGADEVAIFAAASESFSRNNIGMASAKSARAWL